VDGVLVGAGSLWPLSTKCCILQNTPTEGRPVQWALLVLWWQASLTDSLAYTVGGPTCTVVGPRTVLACLSHSAG
jgi:hypothetical protein